MVFHQTRVLYTSIILLLEELFIIVIIDLYRTSRTIFGFSKASLLNFMYFSIGIFIVTLLSVALFPKSNKLVSDVPDKDPHESKMK